MCQVYLWLKRMMIQQTYCLIILPSLFYCKWLKPSVHEYIMCSSSPVAQQYIILVSYPDIYSKGNAESDLEMPITIMQLQLQNILVDQTNLL